MKRFLKYKVFLYPIILLVEYAILLKIAHIFNFETQNSLYAGFSLLVLFSTFIYFLFRIAKDYKDKLMTIKIPFYRISALVGIYCIIAFLAFTLFVSMILIPLILFVVERF